MNATLGRAAIVLASSLWSTAALAGFVDINAGLIGTTRGSLAWGDYDGDGDLDLVVAGETISGRTLRIYRNDAGSFVSISLGLGLSRSAVAWGDYDGDGDLDLAASGTFNGTDDVTLVYRNDGGTLLDLPFVFQPLRDGGLAWGDIDNDGDLDLAATGNSGGVPHTLIYRNDDGVFADANAGLTALAASRLAFGDYDRDGDLDLVTAGLNGTSHTTILYRNDGGHFTSVPSSGLGGTSNGSLDWGDYDNDRDLDLLITGNVNARIYRNASGSFLDIAAGLPRVSQSGGVWGDFNNDALPDVVISGASASGATSFVYQNDVDSFFAFAGLGPGVSQSAVAWADYDNDGDLDVALSGINTTMTRVTQIWQNTGPNAPNSPPSPPSSLAVTNDGSTVTFHWNMAADAQGGQLGLSYNLRIGHSPGANDIMPSMSASSGLRRVPQLGNVGQATEWSIAASALTGGNVYWSVQAIDQSFAGSAFSSGQTVGVENLALPASLRVEGPNPFRSEIRLALHVTRAAHAELAVHDVAGRRVRTLSAGVLDAGTHRLAWNGEDDRGRPAAAGLYFLSLRGGGVVASSRVLKFP